ncbi:MAG TPA: bifunctional proline dehydrogenase/L-glutamate gamma-semialdehyde dehydrogenase PutA [Burkholderiaceae bacterium]|nr:bifunctional proline dehydrogenase/L-glutamate gamma-semialdehyde dehydrogenase PutA [Burkholderiaceae bacterium]
MHANHCVPSASIVTAAQDSSTADPGLALIAGALRRCEPECIAALLPQARLDPPRAAAARELAARLVHELRERRTKSSGVDALMREFSLSSQEGVALMCLAEALLRIPDAATADALIRDKLAQGDWRAHLGRSDSLFVNAAAWGLMISGQLVATHSEAGLGTALTRLLARGGEPLIRKGVDLAMRLLGQQFVTGQTIEEALERAQALEERGYRYSYDMLGEAALTAEDAQRYFDAYEHAIHAIGHAAAGRGIHGGPGISVKLSALHPRYQRAQRERVHAELMPRLAQLCRLARHDDIGLSIDAEESERLALSLELIERLAFDPGLKGWDGLGIVVQAYQKRCPFVIDWLAALAARSGRRFMVRLVKGAYWDSEIKRAQQEGQSDYPVYSRKLHTDVAYVACARRLLAAAPALYPQFATHNALTLAIVLQMADEAGVRGWEFQCLHGMGESLYDQVVGRENLDRPCRIYAPVGTHETLLAYLVRRLLENGANSSFVHRIVDSSVSVADLLQDPVEQASVDGGAPHPRVPLPPELYGAERRNSAGIDLNDDPTLTAIERSFTRIGSKDWSAAPILASDADAGDVARAVTNPARRAQVIGHVRESLAVDVEVALAAAAAEAPAWSAVPALERAALLERAAALLEAQRDALLLLLTHEAGKTLANAHGEVREAVDFLRYYAARARAPGFDEHGTALGVVVAISPWNFPLAIFVGQIAGALAAGNAVIAKSAEQTPLVAAAAVRALHAAGIPRSALQFLPGDGRVGAMLTADARVDGVVFTGSTEVAALIDRALAARTSDREIPLIAETGGQNALIVDSSCLPEQVVADALASAFDSAGQRCSALRVMCVQDDVADKVVRMLEGALAELRVGDPAVLATDVGPVIDAEAQRTIEAHVEAMRKVAIVHSLAAPATELQAGTFCPPRFIEIPTLDLLKREVFGPVLHVLRYRRDDLAALIDGVNRLGYGLTLGIHSRIDETIDFIIGRARVGNIYVNRNMIGAVVGVQPFGGEGLSGTGPKAGGPLYIERLRRPRSAALDWRKLGAQTREAPPLPALDALLEWATSRADRALVQRCTDCARSTPLAFELELPGPTGESNRESFHPRGRVLCQAHDRDGLLAQLAAVFATGNRAIVAASAKDLLPTDLPSAARAEIDFAAAPAAADIDVALCSDPHEAAQLRRLLAAREGRRVRVVTPIDAVHPLVALVVERVVSINTAAAGGNASLMTLEPL